MDLAVAGEQSGVAAFVAGAGPGFAAGLAGEGAGGALVGEAVAVFVGALAAGVVAVQAGSSWSLGDRVFVGAPGAGPMCWAGVGDDWHLLVVLARCNTRPRAGGSAAVRGGRSLCGKVGAIVVDESSAKNRLAPPGSKSPAFLGEPGTQIAETSAWVTSQTIRNDPAGAGYVTDDSQRTGPSGAGYVTDDSQRPRRAGRGLRHRRFATN